MPHRPVAHGVHQGSAGVRRSVAGGSPSAGCGEALRADEPLEVGVGVARFEPGDFGDRLGLEVVAAVARLAALPVGDVGVRLALARAHRRAVDRLLKARGELHA